MNYDSSYTALQDWLPKSKKFYQSNRNYDLTGKQTTSRLSSAISSGILSESEVISSLYAYGITNSSNKFLEEVFWRIYFRGYFETHPTIWSTYKSQLTIDQTELSSDNYQDAINANTGIACFDDWVSDLIKNGYLHNHTRMWFASIWIFTLRLPWTLGCDLFMQHLNDADEASNILSWRWVAGLHTSKKPYVARASNINSFTNKYNPINQLNESPKPIYEETNHDFISIDFQKDPITDCNLLMIDNFLDINSMNLDTINVENFYVLDTTDFNERRVDKISIEAKGNIVDKIAKKMNMLPEFILLSEISKLKGQTLLSNAIRTGELRDNLIKHLDFINSSSKWYQIYRPIDELSWNFCRGGFFKLKTNINAIVNSLLEPSLFSD